MYHLNAVSTVLLCVNKDIIIIAMQIINNLLTISIYAYQINTCPFT